MLGCECKPGSSPPVRGALQVGKGCSCIHGLIPARAGSTSRPSVQSRGGRAHPRPCGEHPMKFRKRSTVLGSSPPVRGAPSAGHELKDQRGLIPARAGSTKLPNLPRNSARAHPRPCGEHSWRALRMSGVLGSSPPVRGALDAIGVSLPPNGLIPARAGSTQLDAI